MEEFVDYFDRGDGEAFVADIAPGFVFYHPSSEHPTTDPDVLRMLAPLARGLLSDLALGDRLEGEGGYRAIRWTATIEGHRAEGIDVLKEAEDGRLLERRMFIRPFVALQAFQGRISQIVGGAGPEALKGRPAAAGDNPETKGD